MIIISVKSCWDNNKYIITIIIVNICLFELNKFKVRSLLFKLGSISSLLSVRPWLLTHLVVKFVWYFSYLLPRQFSSLNKFWECVSETRFVHNLWLSTRPNLLILINLDFWHSWKVFRVGAFESFLVRKNMCRLR